MEQEALKERCKALALRVMSLIDHLPKSVQGRVIADQIMRSASSVAANYRAACRARSKAEFVAKLSIVVEEADETVLGLLADNLLFFLDRPRCRPGADTTAII